MHFVRSPVFFFRHSSDWHGNIVYLRMAGGFSVFAGVGERTREGNDLYKEMIESGVIKLGDKQVGIQRQHKRSW